MAAHGADPSTKKLVAVVDKTIHKTRQKMVAHFFLADFTVGRADQLCACVLLFFFANALIGQ